MDTVTSYRQDYDVKRVEKQMKYYHEDHLRTEGEFIGERRTDYVATKGERVPLKKPQDHLKPEGEFIGRPKEETPTKGERAPVKKPQDNLKFEGEFDSKFLSPNLSSYFNLYFIRIDYNMYRIFLTSFLLIVYKSFSCIFFLQT